MHRVGFLVRYWPARSETFVVREVEGLRSRGVEIDVVGIGARDGDAPAPLRPPRGRGALALLPPLSALSRAEGRGALRWLLRHVRAKDALRALWVADQGAQLGWERVHAHFAGEAAEWAWAAATVLGVPFSVTVHAVDLFKPRPSFEALLRAARPAITVCRHHRDVIRARTGVDAVVVRSGVATDVPLARPGDPVCHLVTVARDVPKKGLDALAAAVGRVDGVTLRLVSDAVRLGGPKILAGPLAPQAVPGVLARASAFVLPCRVAADGDRDGVPVALLEAMAAGLPVVTTAVAGIPELVDDTVGWLLPPDDAPALERALREVRLHPDERAERGRRARQRVVREGWTDADHLDGLLAAWQRDVATSRLEELTG